MQSVLITLDDNSFNQLRVMAPKRERSLLIRKLIAQAWEQRGEQGASPAAEQPASGEAAASQAQ